MPGSAALGTNLVDSLLSVVDDLRGSLHPDMGVRQWRVFVVRRVFASGVVNEGSSVDNLTEILPQPLVSDYGLKYELTPAGLDEGGEIALSEVSLTYTEDELDPSGVAGTQVIYLLRDAHGQSIKDRYYVLISPPKPDRVNTIGWMLRLRLLSEDGCP